MKFLKNIVHKVKPHFSEGGKFSYLHSTFDALETFLFVPGHSTEGRGVHIRDGIDLKRTMFMVVIAMIFPLLFGMWNVGYQHHLSVGMAATATLMDNFLYGLQVVLPIIVVSYGVGLGIEFVFAQIRKHPVNEGFLVTGMLIPLILPPTIPLWMVAVGTAFAVIIGKEVFGGTGMNLLNPALTARVFLFFAYPAEMSGDLVWISEKADSYSGATILGNAAQGMPTEKLGYGFMDAVMGVIPGSIGETSVLMCLIGALILIVSGIGSWRIMLATVLGGLSMGLLLNVIGSTVPETSSLSAGIRGFMLLPAHWHLVIGGFMFGTVYMATDPVSAAQTTTGKYIYGFLIGIFTILIRVFNPAYPEGMMLAILLMNVFAPLIDFYVIQANKNRRLKRATL